MTCPTAIIIAASAIIACVFASAWWHCTAIFAIHDRG